MFMRKVIFGVGEYYHIYARGVDKRDLVVDDCDRRKFMWILQKANSQEYCGRVAIVAYVLMDNHYHLVVRQERDYGVSQFMHSIGNTYVKWFNKRHDRTGRLFSSPYQAKHVDSDVYLQRLIRYIHRNPLNVINGIKSLEQLEAYKWSSYRHYMDLERQSFLDNSLVHDFVSSDEYREYMKDDADEAIEPYIFDED